MTKVRSRILAGATTAIVYFGLSFPISADDGMKLPRSMELASERVMDPPTARAVVQATQTVNFRVFDATLFKGKPDLNQLGFSPLSVIYFGSLWSDIKDIQKLPRPSTVRRIASEVLASKPTDAIMCLDIEHWPLRGDAAVVDESIAKLVQVASWAQEVSPSVAVGYYSLPPLRDYWRAIKGPNSAEYRAWQAENDSLARVGAAVDVLFPSLYTFYDDREGWVKYAIAQISEARRYGKPVYAFLWPQYHNSNPTLGGVEIPRDYWRLQLDTVYQHADGVVIWGGWTSTGPGEWNDTAAWWLETKAFLVELNSGRLPARQAVP